MLFLTKQMKTSQEFKHLAARSRSRPIQEQGAPIFVRGLISSNSLAEYSVIGQSPKVTDEVK